MLKNICNFVQHTVIFLRVKIMNREQYLNKCVTALKPIFAGFKVPQINVSCSWPGGGGNTSKTVGQCWSTSASDAGINEIFISPKIDDSVETLDILVHELCHAVDDCQHGHRRQFTAIMRSVGLEGKPTSTIAGERLHAELIKIADKLGTYPHAKLTPNKPKQKSRQLKASCNDCGAVWRMANSWLQLAICCPCCQSSVVVYSIDKGAPQRLCSATIAQAQRN